MKLIVVALGILAGLSSLPLASTGYALAAAHGGGIVFYLLPAASLVAAGLALDLTALSGFSLLAIALFWFKLGTEIHYPGTVFMTATLAFNAAAGLLGVGFWAVGVFGKPASKRRPASPKIENSAAAILGIRHPADANGAGAPAGANGSSHPRHAERQHVFADQAGQSDLATAAN